MHSIKWTCIVILLRTCTTVLGSTKLKCAPVYPIPSSPVICECEQNSGNDIQWLKDNVIISACFAASGFCSPKPSGYVFSNTLAGSVAYYNLTISSYDYSECGLYTCKDFALPPASDDVLISIFDFDSNSIQMEEPLVNHSNGSINVTTECIFESSNVSHNIKLHKVVNGMATELDRDLLNVTTDSSSCKQCNGEYASKLIVKYEHTEAHGDDVEEVQFQISMFHDLEKDVVLNRTTKNYYNIKSGQDSTTNTNPFTNHTIVGTTSAAVSFSTEVGSNATTETVIFNTTANSTVYPSNEKFKTTYIFVITIIGVVVLGAVVVVLFLCKLRKKTNEER